MAIVNVGIRGQATPVGLFTIPVDLPSGGAIVVGNHLIMSMALDNSGFAGATVGVSVTDPRGNVWTKLASSLIDLGLQDEGAEVQLWISRTQLAYVNGDDITVNTAFTLTRGAISIREWSGIRPITYPIVPASTSISGGSPTNAVTGTPTTVGQLVIGVAALEINTAITGDADVTGGAWVLMENLLSNSGVSATSQTVYGQYKIVTTTAAQSWVITYAGGDSASLMVILDAFVPVAPTTIAGNPNAPCIAGFEGLPTETTSVAVDTGTAYQFQHTILPNDFGTQQYAAGGEFLKPAVNSQHTAIYELFQKDNELPQDEVTTVILTAGAATRNGVPIAITDITVPGSPGVVLDGSVGDYLEVRFNTAVFVSNYANARVVRVGIRYLAWKDDSSPTDIPVGEGFEASWRDLAADGGTGVVVNHGAWLVPNYERDVTYQTRWYGEANGKPRGLFSPAQAGDSNRGAAFTVVDLADMADGPTGTRFRFTALQGSDLLQTDITFDFVELVVEVAPERRIGHATRGVSNATFAGNLYPFGWDSVVLFDALNTGLPATVTGVPNDYVLSVRESLPASPSDYYRALTSGGNPVSFMEAFGPSLQALGYTTPRPTLEPLPTVTKVAVSGGVFASDPVPVNQYTLALPAFDFGNAALEGPFYPGYRGLAAEAAIQVYGAFSKTQYALVDGTTTFDRIKVLVKPDPLTTAPLAISVEQPLATPIATATITVAAALALPDVGDGYREISVPLSNSIMPTAGRVAFVFSSAAAVAGAPWRVAAADPGAGSPSLGYDPGAPNSATSPWDYAAVLECVMATPNLTPSSSSATLLRASDRCLASTLEIPTLLSGNISSMLDRLVVERSINSGRDWTAIRSGLVEEFGPWLRDAFSRTQVASWGTADLAAIAWTTAGGAAADFSVFGWLGRIAQPTTAASRRSYVAALSAEIDIYGEISVPQVQTGASGTAYLFARGDAALANAYSVRLEFTAAGVVNVTIRERIANVEAALATAASLFTYSAGETFSTRFQVFADQLKAKVWRKGTVEPEEWTLEVTDTSLSAANNVGAEVIRLAGNTSTDTSVHFDNVTVGSPEITLDYGVPWDVSPIWYRVTYYRDSDRRAVTSNPAVWVGAPASSPGAAFGLADPEGALILAYVPTDSSSLAIQWSPLNPIDIVALHGVDYQVALRAPEERGLAVSIGVIVDHLTACETGAADAYGGQTVGRGAEAFTPVPYDLLRAAEKLPRLALQLPGGHTRYVSLDLGGMTTQTQHGVYAAEISLTDVIPPDSTVYDS